MNIFLTIQNKMEVPGKREYPDLEKGSQGNAREFCQPCGFDGKHVPAEGFCQSCCDYLCAKCFEAHTIPRPLRNHVLLDKDNMPRSALDTRKPTSTCTITCPNHHGKIIEFFCSAHNDVLCGVCAVIKHKQCKAVYIPDIPEEYKTSEEFTNLIDTLYHLDSDIKTLSSDIKEVTSSVTEASAMVVQEIQQFRKEVNDYLDKQEKELIFTVKRMEQENTKLLHDLTDELDSLKSENSSFMKQLKCVDTEISDLFVTSKQLMKKVQSVLDRFTRCALKHEDISYMFVPGQALKDLLVSNAGLGEIKKECTRKSISYCNKLFTHKEATNTDLTSKEVERKSDIMAKTSEDKSKPRITGMVLLSPHTLLMADYSNNCVKILDTPSNAILSRLSLFDNPWDIAVLPQDQAAVTLYNDKIIQIISTKDRLLAVRNIRVDGNCRGISATMDNLIVSFCNPPKLDLMNIQGTVLVSVKTDSSGHALFSNPFYNTVVVENRVSVIHVSVFSKNSITKLSVEGQVLSTYKHNNWSGLYGMTATGDEQLLVCNRNNHTVDVISEGGKRIQTLLDSTQGIKYPESVCYNAEQNMLYVSSYSGGSVQAYKFTKKEYKTITELLLEL